MRVCLPECVCAFACGCGCGCGYVSVCAACMFITSACRVWLGGSVGVCVMCVQCVQVICGLNRVSMHVCAYESQSETTKFVCFWH